MALLLRPTTLRIGLYSTSALLTTGLLLTSPQRSSLLLRCDGAISPANRAPITENIRAYSRSAKTPVVNPNGTWNAAALKQLSAGSIAGLLGGLAVSVFSKPLAILLGLCIVGVQALQSTLGISLLPYNRLQRTFRNVDFRAAVQDNAAFKLAFGATFALAAFAEF